MEPPENGRYILSPHIDWSLLLNKKGAFDLLFFLDGDYLELYVENKESKLGTFVSVSPHFVAQFDNLIKTNTCDLSKITSWPRRADGAMDYPPPDMSSYKPSHRVIDNLRLRDKADTSSLMVTTLPKDMEVVVVETGPSATIGGITAPWVKVVSGFGYTGWCFSGYLEALPSAATAQETTEPAAATTESAGAGHPVPVLFIALGGGLVLLAAGAAVFLALRRKG